MLLALALSLACTKPSEGPSPGTDDSEPGVSDSAPKESPPDSEPDTGPFDRDGDGVRDGEDCDPDDPDVSTPKTWYADADGDLYGDPDSPIEACERPEGSSPNNTDCDDTRAEVNPGATEICNGLDDDCDSVVDPDTSADAATWYADTDSDGFGDPDTRVVACVAPSGFLEDSQDCDDSDAAVHPDATEICDGIDNDCDALVDPDSSADAGTWYADADSDGYGDAGRSFVACTAPSGTVSEATDCDDSSADVNPGATEVCNGLDDDCDTVVDPDTSADVATWFHDFDGDGFGDPDDSDLACDQPSDFVSDDSDCDDTDADINPSATESCDGVDEDCDGDVDEEATDALTVYTDSDGDGYGDSSSSSESCSVGSGTSETSGDCDDADSGVNPGATEICGDGTDQDCDGYDSGDSECPPEGTVDDWDAIVTGSSSGDIADLALLEDIDGDGFHDLALGVPEAGSSSEGRVYVFSELPVEDSSHSLSAYVEVFIGADTDDLFGQSLASFGDVDGDSLDELAIGAPGEDDAGSNAGAVYLFSGGSGSLTYTSDAWAVFDGAEAGDALGSQIANVGDLDGDGLDELAMGSAGADLPRSSSGGVWVAFGADWADGAVSNTEQALFKGERASDQLALSGPGGDLNDDGYEDLVLASSGSDEGGGSAGSAWVWFGPISDGDHEVNAAHLRLVGSDSNDAFGASIAGGVDLDGDQIPDLAVGATGSDDPSSGAGSAHVFFGPLPIGTIESDDSDLLITGTTTNEGVGSALATGDLDGDGYGELLLGVPNSDLAASGEGGAFLFYGPLSSGELDLNDADALVHSSTGDEAGDLVRFGDIDQDGYDELMFRAEGSSTYDRLEIQIGGDRGSTAATAPDTSTDDDGDGYSEDDGDCDDMRASRAPDLAEVCDAGGDEDCDGYADRCIDTTDLIYGDLDSLVTNDISSARADLGEVVRVVGDVNGDGVLDVAVQDDRYDTNAGRVLVFFGPVPSGSVTGSDADVELLGVASNDSSGDILGPAGDLDGDGFGDLLVGSPLGSRGGSEDGFVSVFFGGPEFGGSYDLSDADLIVYGDDDDRNAGYGGGACDLDGDGHDDLLVGSPGDEVDGQRDAGTLNVIFGPFSSGTDKLDDVADVVLYGDFKNGALGRNARCWGDLDGDGQHDLLATSPDWSMAVGSDTDVHGRFLLFRGPLSSGELLLTDADVAIGGPGEDNYEETWTVGDLDGDFLPELVISHDEGSWSVIPLAGLAGNVELVENSIATLEDPSGLIDEDEVELATGDLNRDGVGDLVVGSASSSTGDGAVRIFYGPVSGELSLNYPDLTLEGGVKHVLGQSVDVADLDRDGFDDVITGLRDHGSSSYTIGAFGVLRGGWDALTRGEIDRVEGDEDGDGDFETGEDGDCHNGDSSISSSGTEVCGNALDEDCDGFALACSPTGGRTDQLPVLALEGYIGPDRELADVGDLNGDGITEIVAIDSYYELVLLESPYPPFGSYEIDDLQSESLGTFSRPGTVSLMPDLDGDGLEEWLVTGGSGEIWIWDTSGGTSSRTVSDAAWTFEESWMGGWSSGGEDPFGSYDAGVMMADTSGDYGSYTANGAVYVFGVDASVTGTLTASDADLVIHGEDDSDYLGSRMSYLGDLDGDGLAELAFSTSKSGTTKDEITYVWASSDGTGTLDAGDLSVSLQDTTYYAPMRPWNPGDLDGDGTDDLAVAHPYHVDGSLGYSGRVWVWSGMPAAGDYSPVTADFEIQGTESNHFIGDGIGQDVDLDGDGSLDLVVGAPIQWGSTGSVHLWYGPVSLSGTVDVTDSEGSITGLESQEDFGRGVAGAGDVDGDGYEDLWVGDHGYEGYLSRGGPR